MELQLPVVFNDRYQLIKKIGEGGLAEVYQAQDMALGRLVADRIRRALDVIPADRLVINPDCGLVHLPRDVAFRKLSAMAEGARMVREGLSR